MIKSQNLRKWIRNKLVQDKIETIDIKMIMIKRLNDEDLIFDKKPILIDENQWQIDQIDKDQWQIDQRLTKKLIWWRLTW